MQNNGQLIGNRYQLANKLGAGSMGEVFRAVDKLTEHTIALKRVTVAEHQLVFGSEHGKTNVRMALAHEFQTLASLHHPHIISVLDYGFDAERQPYFTMSLLEDSQTIVQAGDDASDADRVRLLVEMLQALAYLHRRGIVHRDLKPANVLVDGSGQVKVLDFGLAAERQREGEAVGTLAYMAPEIMMEQPASNASDLYATGVMAYELFAGRHPFASEDTVSLVTRTLTGSPDLAVLPKTVSAIIGKLLARDPENRYQDADATIREFSEAIGQAIPKESAAIRDSFLQAAKFVGRSAEMTKLSDALEAALEGKGSAWLIGGESGVGKSRLVDELSTKAMVEGALVLRGQSVAEGGLPYQLWRDPIRRLVLSTELSDLESSVLKELVPDISTLLGREVPDAPELDGEAQQQRLMLTSVDVFRRQKQPLVLLLEDLHWAGESSILLRQFCSIIGELPLVVVGNYRDDEYPDLPKELPDMELLTLARLSQEEIAELSVSMLGGAGARPQVMNLLQRETEGNVFFLVEVVRALAEEAGRISDVGSDGLPDTVFAGGVQQVVQRRLDRVPDSAQEMLKLAAVAGRRLDIDLLCLFAEPEMDLDNWLITCANVAVLEVQEGIWRFAHEKLRAGLLGTLTDEELPTLHQKVAGGMEAIYPDDEALAVTLVEHWRIAGNSKKELRSAQQAGDYALRTGNLVDAKFLFERAIALLDSTELTGTASQASKADIQVKLGKTLNYLGEYDAAITHLEDAEKYYREQGAREGIAQAVMEISEVLKQQGDYAQSVEHTTESLAIYAELGQKPGMAHALDRLSLLRSEQGDYENATALGEEGLSLARELDDRVATASLMNNLGVAAFAQGKYAEATTHWQGSKEICQSTGERRKVATLLMNLGSAAGQQGDLTACHDYFEQALEVFRGMGEQRLIGLTLRNLGLVADMQDDYDLATRYYGESLGIVRAIGNKPEITKTLIKLGDLARKQGEDSRAREQYQEALSQAFAIDAVPVVLSALVALAQILEDKDIAVTIVGHIQNNSATNQDTLNQAESLAETLQQSVESETYTRLLEGGKSTALEDIVEQVLNASDGTA